MDRAEKRRLLLNERDFYASQIVSLRKIGDSISLAHALRMHETLTWILSTEDRMHTALTAIAERATMPSLREQSREFQSVVQIAIRALAVPTTPSTRISLEELA